MVVEAAREGCSGNTHTHFEVKNRSVVYEECQGSSMMLIVLLGMIMLGMMTTLI